MSRFFPALAAAAVLAIGGSAFAQVPNSGNTGGGASTNTGAGIVTSGSAVPAGRQPRAVDTTVGKTGQGTGAGMGDTLAGSAPRGGVAQADVQPARKPVAKAKRHVAKATKHKKGSKKARARQA